MTAELTPDMLDDLRGRLSGYVVAPADPQFPAASSAWSLVPQEPLAVVQASGVDDVVATVRWASRHGVPVAVQPTGHGALGAATGAILLRTSALGSFAVDAQERVARIGAGVTWGDFLPALDGRGLIALAGSNPGVAITGYLLGGGLSWFARLRGYAAHALRAATVVDAAGVVRRVDDESDPDLMWALRGGGGDFAIVTEVELDLIPAESLYGGKLMFPVTDARAVLEAFLTATRTAPAELALWCTVMHMPDVELLPEFLRGKSFISVDSTFVGPAAEGSRLLDPIRAAGSLIDDTTAEFPIGRLGDVAAEPTDPTPVIDWGTFLTALTEQDTGRLVDVIGDPGRTALNLVQLRHLGAALADPPHPRPGVVHGTRARFVIDAIGIPMGPDAAEPIRASIGEVADALRGRLSDERLPLNFLGVGDELSRAFDPATLTRLQEVKRTVDPANTVRGNAPVVGVG